MGWIRNLLLNSWWRERVHLLVVYGKPLSSSQPLSHTPIHNNKIQTKSATTTKVPATRKRTHHPGAANCYKNNFYLFHRSWFNNINTDNDFQLKFANSCQQWTLRIIQQKLKTDTGLDVRTIDVMGRTKRVRYPTVLDYCLLLHFLCFLHHHSVCHIWLAYVGHIYIPVLFYDLAPHRFNVCCVPLLVVTYLYGCLLHAPSAGHPPHPLSSLLLFIHILLLFICGYILVVTCGCLKLLHLYL